MLSLFKKIIESGKITVKFGEISGEGGFAILVIFVIAMVFLFRV